MIHKKYKIAISSIGSGIGQSIINAIRLSNLPFRTIGFGNNPFAFGSYDCDDFDLIAYGINRSKVENLFKGKVKAIYDYKDLKQRIINLGNVDLLLHLGFTRPFGENKQIADSLRFTSKLFTLAAQNQLPAVIYISSQSVYGLTSPPIMVRAITNCT